MKNNTGKKITVIDELDIKGSGVYCFLPFEKLDKNKKAVFKIGIATRSFKNRVEQYHTYLPKGVYMVAFLVNPSNRRLRSKTEDLTLKQLYLKIEKFIIKDIIENGGKRIYTTTRVKNPNERLEGETEWVYTNEEIIHNAFRKAHEEFKGELKLFNLETYNPQSKKLESINDIAKENENKKPNYVGEIVFHY